MINDYCDVGLVDESSDENMPTVMMRSGMHNSLLAEAEQPPDFDDSDRDQKGYLRSTGLTALKGHFIRTKV